MKTVVYDGYEFQVPASWPVYRLDEYPHDLRPLRRARRLPGHAGREHAVPGRARRPDPDGELHSRRSTSRPDPGPRPSTSASSQRRRRHRTRAAARGPRRDHAERRPSTSCRSRSARRRSAPRSSGPTAPIRRSSSRCSAPCGPPRPARRRRPSQRVVAALCASRGRAPAATWRRAPRPAGGRVRRDRPRAACPGRHGPRATGREARQGDDADYTSWRGVPPNWPVQIVQSPPPPSRSIR